MPDGAHIVITDSGLGGLSICAALEQGLRLAGVPRAITLTYVNAWPFEDRGYNDLPDTAARARVFDAALTRMAAMQPDCLLIACNTLSILYPHTDFSRRPTIPVHGIVGAGVSLFAERLNGDPAAVIVLIGTKTTIESGVHRDALVQLGIDPARIASATCHGLAGAIERDVDGTGTAELIEACAGRAAEAAPAGGTLFIGLCCTHYAYVAVRIADGVARRARRRVRVLDPNLRMVGDLLAGEAFVGETPAAGARPASTGDPRRPAGVSVTLISKVTLDEKARSGIARLVEPVSAATAGALLSYARISDLF